MEIEMAGRKSKLTQELTKVFCENIELGLSYNLSCQAVGISFQAFNEWMKSGYAGTEKRHICFYDAVRAAEAECAKNCLTRIRAAAESGSLAGDLWLLERRYPADYGRKDHLNMKSQSEALNYNVDIPADEIEKRRSSILKGILGELETESTETDSSESFRL
jgi:transposase